MLREQYSIIDNQDTFSKLLPVLNKDELVDNWRAEKVVVAKEYRSIL